MEPTSIAAAASVTAGLGLGTLGVWRGVTARRRLSAATYLEQVLDTEDDAPRPTGWRRRSPTASCARGPTGPPPPCRR
jgi:hypothetical protein